MTVSSTFFRELGGGGELILIEVYPTELEIKDTTDTNGSASYLDTPIEIECEGRLRTKLYDKRDGFSFLIVNFPFTWCNIQTAPTCIWSIHLSLCDIPEHVIHIRTSLIEDCC